MGVNNWTWEDDKNIFLNYLLYNIQLNLYLHLTDILRFFRYAVSDEQWHYKLRHHIKSEHVMKRTIVG